MHVCMTCSMQDTDRVISELKGSAEEQRRQICVCADVHKLSSSPSSAQFLKVVTLDGDKTPDLVIQQVSPCHAVHMGSKVT